MFNIFNEVTQNDPNASSDLNSIEALLSVGVNLAVGVGIALSVIFIGYAGIQIMASKDDAKKFAKAQTGLVYAVIAFLLSVGAITARYIVLNVIGAEGTITNATPSFQ